MKHHFTPIGLENQESLNTANPGKDVGKQEHSSTVGAMKTGVAFPGSNLPVLSDVQNVYFLSIIVDSLLG